ncbi:universal stress protein Slr1230-like isoform X2 [Argopecten irradians]|uniref:universal stress protein Slr1230-like isoform X2 n=1 Tax=Argopecten irradians TaxID=31199 RepID=UPI003719E89A
MSKPRKILLAMDGSYHSEFAFESLGSADIQSLCTILDEEADEHKILVENLTKKLESTGLKGMVRTQLGKAGEIVMKIANEENVDQIICGSRGHSKMRRTLMGSHSDYILHHAHVPVTVCRHPKHIHVETVAGSIHSLNSNEG